MAIFQSLWTPYSKLWTQLPGSPYFLQVGLVLPVTPPSHWEGFIFFNNKGISSHLQDCQRPHLNLPCLHETEWVMICS